MELPQRLLTLSSFHCILFVVMIGYFLLPYVLKPQILHTQWSATDHIRAPPHHPAPAQLILHGGRRLVFSGHNHSWQLTGLSKSFLITCQQQSRLNYKKSVYSAHTKGGPRVLSLGNRGGCATGPERIPTTLGHTTKTKSQSSFT